MSYDGRTAALATQHGKECVIAPPFARQLGLGVTVPQGLDTDALGTFTGETPRPGTLRETLRRKARLGMEASGLPLGIASEGSFGPHPFMPFLALGREAMIFIDDTCGVEVIEEMVSEKTNFAALDLVPRADIGGFLLRIGFPAHAVVLRNASGVFKGIDSYAALERVFATHGETGRLETDMRAHLNPTRMVEIGRLAEKLAARVATPCPACAAPGYGPVRSEPGLPCAECGMPTPLLHSIVCGCALCRHEHPMPRPDGRAAASPAECPACNP